VKPERPTLHAIPAVVLEDDLLLLRAAGWPDGATKLTLGGQETRMARILQGRRVRGGVRPDDTGAFVVRVATYGLKPGHYELRASAGKQKAMIPIEIVKRARPREADRKADRNLAYWRGRAAFQRRFAHVGYVPEGVKLAQMRSIERMREEALRRRPDDRILREPHPGGTIFFSLPVPGGCNWTPLGPAPIVPGGIHHAWSGRVRSIAVDPSQPSRIYLGTANAGVWKSTDSGATWSPKTDDKPSMAIGALAVDPNAPNRVFAGTGEYHQADPYNGYSGLGLLHSTDFGESWTLLAAATFERVEIARILFDPNDTANHMFLACDAGVYESNDGGSSWTPLRAGSASDLVLLASGGTLQLIAAFHSEGIFTNTLSGGSWSGWILITSTEFPAAFGRIVLGQSRNLPDRIWAAFGGADLSSLAGIARSDDGGGSWTGIANPTGSPIWGTNYNFHLAIHPDLPDTVFLGMNRLWRTDTGDAPWADVTGGAAVALHSDHHAFAFDPVSPAIVYACGDGGVYRSSDGGANWEHRNRDLGTLQLYHLTNHPQWAAIVLAGTQDNGGAFSDGTPGWKWHHWLGLPFNALGGDVVVTAIEPLLPSRMYYGLYGQTYRSDNGGRLWDVKHSLGFAAEWNFPFVVDQGVAGVCYVAGNALERSGDAGEHWQTITPLLTGNVTTMAVHPADSNIVYVGTSQGRVYRIQRTGADWTLAGVTTTDVTGPPLPAGLYISCVAVDAAGNVWVSFSAILQTEEPGEFTNDHVYRLPAGSTTWQNRSAGLLQANPINTIVIDPNDPSVVFCGGDVGVYRWNAGASTWEPWDQGLPNSPVLHLAVHQPSRLLRAATYGRGAWERPLDAAACPAADIYMRDNILDTGRGPAPVNVAHPFDPANLVWWWQSEDIKVDAPPFQTPAPVTDHVALWTDVEHRNARRGMSNRFYVQVHNRGAFTATNVSVRAFFANASPSLPNLPADFWTAGRPFAADPAATHWAAIGPTQSALALEAGDTAVFAWEWTVPASAGGHSCLLALATCAEDPLAAGGTLMIADLVPAQNNVTLKNLTIV
jgi:photosystem II stability/assembly factor-like uncharacterized protein